LQRAEADLDGEFAAVLAQAVQLHGCSHGPLLRVAEESAAMPAVTAAKTLRHEHLERVGQQLFATVPEKLLGLAIDQNYPPVPIDHDDGVRGAFEQCAKPLLRLSTLRDIPDNTAHHRSFLSLNRAEAYFHGEFGAVFT